MNMKTDSDGQGALPVTLFRHALGTHLYENGADLLTIQAYLGHRSLSSTTIYVHLASSTLSKVKNPLDQMGGMHCE